MTLDEILMLAREVKQEVEKFKPLVDEEFKHLNFIEFKDRVCFKHITEDVIAKSTDGDILYQCSFSNRRFFDRLNRKRYYEDHNQRDKAKEMEQLLDETEEPTVSVQVVGYGKFAVNCPHWRENSCPLRDYVSLDWREKIEGKSIEGDI